MFLAFIPKRYLALVRRLKGGRSAPASTSPAKAVCPENQPTAELSDQPCEIERSGLTMAQAEELLDWLENNECTSRKVTWRQDKKIDLDSGPHQP